MKKIMFMVVLLLLACDSSKMVDREFKDYYYFRISELIDYDNLCASGDEIHIQDWARFLETCSYLEMLTGCELHYTHSEPPGYANIQLLEDDTATLGSWFRTQGHKWTKSKADRYVYRKRKGHDVYF